MSSTNYFAPPEKRLRLNNQNQKFNMKKIFYSTERQVSLDGLMTYGKCDNGLRTMDFMCCEDAVMEPFKGSFYVQGMRDGNVYMQEHKKRIRNNALLIRKARHGRVSGTRDNGWQLTLKVFASEGIDWQKAFVEEPIEVMTDLMGPERMSEILKEALKKLEAQSLVEKDWKPFGVEW
jgi:hypothetical protein